MVSLLDARSISRVLRVLGLMMVALVAAPAAAQITLGTGTEPAPGAVACPAPNPPGTAAPAWVDGFTFTGTVNDSVTGIKVQLKPFGAYALLDRVEIRSGDEATVYGAIRPTGDLQLISLTQPITIIANQAPVPYRVVVVPKAHAAMPPRASGTSMAISANVVAVSSTKTKTLQDTASGTVTIDNAPPAEIVWASVTAGATAVDLVWQGSVKVLVLRRLGGPVLDAPDDGASYSVGTALTGGSQVVYAPAAAVSGFKDMTSLTPNRPHFYRVFVKDDCGNYSAGSSIGPLFPGGVAEGDASKPSYRPVIGLLNPAPGPVNSPFRVQVRVFSPKTAGGATQPIQTVELVADDGVSPSPQTFPMQRNAALGTDLDSGIYHIPNGLTLAAGRAYTLRARATNGTSAPNNIPVYSAPVGVVVSATKGDGNLLVRDNSSQLCQDCHNVQTHSSEVTGTELGSWYVGCRGCHQPHGTTNAGLIATEITPPSVRGELPPSKVYFSGKLGYAAQGGASNPSEAAYANGDPGVAPGEAHTGVCQVCHTATQFWTRTGAVSDHYGDQKCTGCHSHTKGMAASCTGCHGNSARTSIAGADALQTAAPPRAVSGATATTDQAVGEHEAHVNRATLRSAPLACADCHQGATHATPADPGNAQVFFGALGSYQSPLAAWNPGGSSCASTYCHGATLSGGTNLTPSWTLGQTMTCSSCHGAPPSITIGHPRNTSCVSCHGTDYAAANADKTNHINKNLDVVTSGCTACHGTLSASGVTLTANTVKAAPGVDTGSVDVAGNTVATKPGVGAHKAHLTGTRLRQGAGATCGDCHQLPPGDADTTHANGTGTNGARATLAFSSFTKGGALNFAASYTGSNSAGADTTSGTCSNTYCHGAGYAGVDYKGTNQAPRWSGGAAEAACGTCHKAPPSTPAHDTVTTSTDCGMCHPGYAYTLASGGTLGENHINGAPDISGGCTTCHGTDGVNAAPPRAWNTSNPNAIGAHQAHVSTASMTTRSAAFACTECHPMPSGTHPGNGVEMVWSAGLSPNTVWKPGSSTCESSYCHGGTTAQGIWGGLKSIPNWLTPLDGTQKACTACHGAPPALSAANPHPTNTACGACHPSGSSSTAITAASAAAGAHVNGTVDVHQNGCAQCHGDLASTSVVASTNVAAAPGSITSGRTGADITGATTGARVGAHWRHLQGLPASWGVGSGAGRATQVPCAACHQVPTSGTTHATGPRATLTFDAFSGGASAGYASGTCSNVYCHTGTWAAKTNTRGTAYNPSWTATAYNCGSCHQSPPATASHDGVLNNKNCSACHTGYTCTVTTGPSYTGCTVDATTHINGVVDLATGFTCTNCHGSSKTVATTIGSVDSNLNASPPPDTAGAASSNPVGPHIAHVNPTSGAPQIYLPVKCSDCHGTAVNSYTSNPSHANATTDVSMTTSTGANLTIAGGTSATVQWTPGNPGSCVTYCHGDRLKATSKGTVTAVGWKWDTATNANCGSCHGAAPNDVAHTSVSKTAGSTPTACYPCHQGVVNSTGAIVFTGTGASATTKHIDGLIDLTGATCTSCHGQTRANMAGGTVDAFQTAAPPLALTGGSATTVRGVGAHVSHVNQGTFRTNALACSECHQGAVPLATAMNHANGTLTVAGGTLTLTNTQGNTGAAQALTWNGTTCASTYCHGNFRNGRANTPSWTGTFTATSTLHCNSCHGASAAAGNASLPGGTHPQGSTDCSMCHAGYTLTTVDKTKHLNGVIDYDTKTCDSCHGTSSRAGIAGADAFQTAAPPQDLTKSTATTSRGVGAHVSHVNQGTFRTAPLACSECHSGAVPVATNMFHTNATLTVAGGTLTLTSTQGNTGAAQALTWNGTTCASTYCHGNFRNGRANTPIWTGTFTATSSLHCNSCHGASNTSGNALLPGGTHPQGSANCTMCHAGYTQTAVDKTKHLNGLIDYDTKTCTSCHGNSTRTNMAGGTVDAFQPAAPPQDLATNTATTARGVGAHVSHVNKSSFRTNALACSECHSGAVPVATNMFHTNGTKTVVGGTLALTATEGTAGGTAQALTWNGTTCANTYCHGNFSGGGNAAPAWAGTFTNVAPTNTSSLTCTSCHAAPPGDSTHAGIVSANTNCSTCHGTSYNCLPNTLGSCQVDKTQHINGTITAPLATCASCHGGAADVNNWATADSVKSIINTGAEWTSYGHGNTAPTFDEFTGATDRCLYCHDGTVAHATATNPFRLRGAASSAGATGAYNALSAKFGNEVCLNCHDTSATVAYGVDPDGAGAQPRVCQTGGTNACDLKVDSWHYGTDHLATQDGGERCWDCHDPHGDGTNLAMIGSDTLRDAGDDYGLTGTRSTTAAVLTTRAAGGYTNTTTRNGICQVCHTTTAYWRSTSEPAAHNAGTDCMSCHNHVQPPNKAFAGSGDCTLCHNTTQTISNGPLAGQTRRAIVPEFSNTWSHKRSAANAVTKYDCAVCHMEGDAATGDMTPGIHGDGYLNLRDPDTGTNIKTVTFGGTNAGAYTSTTTNATFTRFGRDLSKSLQADTVNGANVQAMMINQCLKCHDADGALSTAARVPGGTAGKPFNTSITGTGYAGANGLTACPTTDGCVVDVASDFATTNASYHPILGKQNNSYVNATRLKVPYNTVTKTAGNTTSWGILLSCFDCHAANAATGLQTTTVTAHGGPVTIRQAVWVSSTSYTAAAGSGNLCLVCHNVAATADTHSTGSAWSGGSSNSTPGGYGRQACYQCHSSAKTKPARPLPAQDAHGFDAFAYTMGTDKMWPVGATETFKPYAFMRNVGSAGNWSASGNLWRPASGPGVSGGAICSGNCGRSSHASYTPGGAY